MARGDGIKTASKANNLMQSKQFDVSAPIKKQITPTTSSYSAPKKEEPKNYGAWGPVFKDKKSFTDMHFC